MSIDILMATFNGGKYLRNQLFSLQQQTYEDWELWVRDDGSTDQTLEIVREFAQRDLRIHLVEDKLGKKLGPGKSFLELTRYSMADYVIFCDQDDIWFEKKLEILQEYATNNFNSEIPSLVYCDGYGYSDKEGIIMIDGISRLHAQHLKDFLFFNAGYQGCSMLFNKKLCTLAAAYRADYFFMHDDIVSLLAHVFGVVSFLPKKLMLYRQHGKNVTGNIEAGISPFIRRALQKDAFVISKHHYKEKEAFYAAYQVDLSENAKDLFKAFFLYPKLGRIGRVFLIVRYGFSLGGNKGKLIVKSLVRKAIG